MAQEPFGDIPLFREIQRILASSEGPVNLEIARQVGNALATQGTLDTSADDDTKKILEEGVHEAESLVAGLSRLPLDEPLQMQTMGRGRWVESTLSSWKWVLEHLARHFVTELEGADPSMQTATGPLQGALTQAAPLLIGVQAGTLVGHLSRSALTRYDFPIPREDDGKVFFVVPNVDKVQTEYSLDRRALLRWLALHSAARHLVLNSSPWIVRYLRGLITEVVDATEIDFAGLEQRLVELQSKGMEGIEADADLQTDLPVVSTERHREALDRLSAFVAVFEGYSDHLQESIAPQLIDDASRVAEGIARSRSDNQDAESLLAKVLGVSFDRQLESAGRTFCAAVVQLKSLPLLNSVWQAPDNLPSLAEIKDPFAWMERVGES
ncbi:MAG: zinc-dependent metalloprotease [Actinomycetota bacterium]|nr:zinc-dependent metalloprotease [Actinomycetota bacterium]